MEILKYKGKLHVPVVLYLLIKYALDEQYPKYVGLISGTKMPGRVHFLIILGHLLNWDILLNIGIFQILLESHSVGVYCIFLMSHFANSFKFFISFMLRFSLIN